MNAHRYLAIFVLTLVTSCGGERASNSAKSANAPSSSSQSSATNASGRSQGDLTDQAKKDVGGGGNGRGTGSGSGNGTGSVDDTLALKPNPAAQLSLANTTAATTDTAPTDRKIVRNADLSLEAGSPEDVQHKITAIAEGKGGFVVDSSQSSSDTKVAVRDVVAMTVRIPAAKFTESMEEIRKTASRVIVETVKGEDVTEEFVDIEARLKAKRAVEQQFMEIMKRATKVEDALSVQNELGSIRSDIERIEGRKHFLENQASMSTIKVKIQTQTAFSPTSTGFVYKLGESLSSGIDFALNFVLGLVTLLIAILPFAVFIVLPLFLIIRYTVRKRGQPETVSSIAKDEIK